MSAQAFEQPSILIVDDNPLITNVLKSLLLSEHYQVFVTSNGSEALSVLDTKEVDVIICDIMMPHMDGYQLQSTIRQRPELSHIPFIFLSALGDNLDITKGKESGADDYMVKPFDPKHLLSTVKGKVARARNLKDHAEAMFESYRKRVVHTLSHEFRTPLVAINTGTELLLEQNQRLDTAKIQNLLEAIRRGGQRLERLVNDFMLLQQVEAGIAQRLYDSRAVITKIGQLVAQFAEQHQEDLTQQGYELKVVDNSGSCGTKMYEPQIFDILDRLLQNAVKFSKTERKIEIHLCPCGEEIAIEMRDRGIGIDVARVREAIDIFGQIDRDKLEQQGGGLGLAIANRYAAIHGGRLDFENRDGGGAVVSLMLPVHQKKM